MIPESGVWGSGVCPTKWGLLQIKLALPEGQEGLVYTEAMPSRIA